MNLVASLKTGSWFPWIHECLPARCSANWSRGCSSLLHYV